MSARAIQITTFTNPNTVSNGVGGDGTTASTRLINTAKILSIKTRAVAYRTTGIVDVVYEWPVNEAITQVTFIVTETQAALLTAINASTTPA